MILYIASIVIKKPLKLTNYRKNIITVNVLIIS